MSSSFHPDAWVEEFIADLRTFATGSYLGEGETEHWEGFYDPACLTELEQILRTLIADMATVPLAETLIDARTKLQEFNAQHQDAVLEEEEYGDLQEFFQQLGHLHGLDNSQIPLLMEEDEENNIPPAAPMIYLPEDPEDT